MPYPYRAIEIERNYKRKQLLASASYAHNMNPLLNKLTRRPRVLLFLGTFDDLDKDEDHILKFDNELSILLDELSYPYIAGSVVDYKEGLMGAKFTVENPNAKSTCGCGASFSI